MQLMPFTFMFLTFHSIKHFQNTKKNAFFFILKTLHSTCLVSCSYGIYMSQRAVPSFQELRLHREEDMPLQTVGKQQCLLVSVRKVVQMVSDSSDVILITLSDRITRVHNGQLWLASLGLMLPFVMGDEPCDRRNTLEQDGHVPEMCPQG